MKMNITSKINAKNCTRNIIYPCSSEQWFSLFLAYLQEKMNPNRSSHLHIAESFIHGHFCQQQYCGRANGEQSGLPCAGKNNRKAGQGKGTCQPGSGLDAA